MKRCFFFDFFFCFFGDVEFKVKVCSVCRCGVVRFKVEVCSVFGEDWFLGEETFD